MLGVFTVKRISKILLIALIICITLSLPACIDVSNSASTSGENNVNGSEQTENNDEVYSMKIIIGNEQFSATLYDTETAQAFAKLLPLTLDMSELNGNEKYNYLPTTLPTKTERVDNINAGDIMLYGNSCIVLFYKSFSTSYSYTKIGKIDDVTGLQQAVGGGNIAVTFQTN